MWVRVITGLREVVFPDLTRGGQRLTDTAQVIRYSRYVGGCRLDEYQQRTLRRLVYALAICYEQRKSSPTHVYGLYSARHSDMSSSCQWTDAIRQGFLHTPYACLGRLYMHCFRSTRFRDKTRGLPFILYRGIESDRAGELSDENNGIVSDSGSRLVGEGVQSQVRRSKATPNCPRLLPVFIREYMVVAALGFWIRKSIWRCFALHGGGRWSRGIVEKSLLYRMSGLAKKGNLLYSCKCCDRRVRAVTDAYFVTTAKFRILLR